VSLRTWRIIVEMHEIFPSRSLPDTETCNPVVLRTERDARGHNQALSYGFITFVVQGKGPQHSPNRVAGPQYQPGPLQRDRLRCPGAGKCWILGGGLSGIGAVLVFPGSNLWRNSCHRCDPGTAALVVTSGMNSPARKTGCKSSVLGVHWKTGIVRERYNVRPGRVSRIVQ